MHVFTCNSSLNDRYTLTADMCRMLRRKSPRVTGLSQRHLAVIRMPTRPGWACESNPLIRYLPPDQAEHVNQIHPSDTYHQTRLSMLVVSIWWVDLIHMLSLVESNPPIRYLPPNLAEHVNQIHPSDTYHQTWLSMWIKSTHRYLPPDQAEHMNQIHPSDTYHQTRLSMWIKSTHQIHTTRPGWACESNPPTDTYHQTWLSMWIKFTNQILTTRPGWACESNPPTDTYHQTWLSIGDKYLWVDLIHMLSQVVNQIHPSDTYHQTRLSMWIKSTHQILTTRPGWACESNPPIRYLPPDQAEHAGGKYLMGGFDSHAQPGLVVSIWWVDLIHMLSLVWW